MKKPFPAILLVALVLLSINLPAQDFNDYKFLKSTGKVPANFIKSTKQKSDEEIKKTFEGQKRARYKSQKKAFILEGNFAIDELLLSGRVLFNDSVGQYANKIVDILLKDDPKLRREIEVYVVKSSVVNAFTTSRGTIFINLGLISKLHSEAELAYVLCHEIIHYKNKHVMSEFEVTQDIKRGNGSFANTNYGDMLLAKSIFSKELEKEADIQGLEIFRKSKYNLTATTGVFDVLQYAHIPYKDAEFNTSFLEFESYKFPIAYLLAETQKVVANTKDDSFSTHPGIDLRRDTIKSILKGVSNQDRVNYQIDSGKFDRIREIARFEIAEYYIESRQYEAAIYHAYLLLQSHPDSRYLQKIIMRGLYGLAKYSAENKKRFEEVHQVYEDMEGKQQEIFYLFYKLNEHEMYTIALNYAWRLKKKYPGDEEINAIADEEFTTMVDDYFPAKDFFSTTPNTAVASKDSTVEMTVVKFSDKSESHKTDSVPAYTKYAFVTLLKDDAFLHTYDSIAVGRKKRAEEKARWNTEAEQDRRKKIRKKRLRKGHQLGVDKVVIVNPFYYKINSGLFSRYDQLGSEKAQAELSKEITEMAAEADLTYELLDKKHLEENGAQAFNDNALLSSFIKEYYAHGSMDFINYKRPEIKELIARHKTKYFCWTGVISQKEFDPLVMVKTIEAVFLFPMAPYLFYKAYGTHNTTYQYSLVINLETGETCYYQLHAYKMKDRRDVVKTSLYDLFMQFKTPPSL